jgi:ATP-dependent helicase/DNAse subunit B
MQKMGASPFAEGLHETINRIKGEPLDGELPRPAGEGRLRISPTDLTEFFSCSIFWLYKRVLGLEEYESDAALLDDESLGNLYHAILEMIFTRIKNEGDGSFNARDLEQYNQWAEECTPEVLKSGGKFRGLLAYPLQGPLAAAMVKRIKAILKTEARYFAAYTVEALEKKLSFDRIHQGKGEMRFTGKIDRISVSPQGRMIIDYKTGSTPAQNHCREDRNPLKDFQIPMYIKLLEEESGEAVQEAYFFSINKNDLTLVVGELEGKRSFSREKYQPTMEALDQYIDRFYRALVDLDFSLEKIPFKNCLVCPFKIICRSVYSLNSGIARAGNYGDYDEDGEDAEYV